MGRQKMGYTIALMLFMSGWMVMGKENTLTPRTVLQACECWESADDRALQVGKVILRFSENPMIHPLPSTIYTKRNNHIFFIPTGEISDEALRNFMAQVKNQEHKWYSISISCEKKPIAGIKVVFTYDPEKVSIEHKAFNTLGTEKGVMFRLYNKALVDFLKSKERSLLRVAMAKPLTMIA